MADDPILQNLPQVQRAFEKKYQSTNQELLSQALDPKVFRSALALDVQRVRRGQMPVPEEKGLKAAIAAQTRQAVTPAEENAGLTDLPTNFARDAKTIAKSLPQIPRMLVDEVKAVGNFSDELSKVDDLGDFFDLPGVRLVPLSFILSGLLPGGQPAGDLLKHPLLTGLDALPFASKAAKASPVFKAATEQAELARLQGGFAPKPRPISTVLTSKLGEAGNIERTAVGRGVDAARATRPAQALESTFGRPARDVMFRLRGGEQDIYHRLHGQGPLDPNDVPGQVGREWMRVANDPDELMARFGITQERMGELSRIGRFTPEDIGRLPGNEQTFVKEWQAATQTLGDEAVARGELTRIGDEFYDNTSGNRILRAQERVVKQSEKFFQGVPRGRGKTSTPGVDQLRVLAQTDPRWAEILDMVDNGRYADAGKRVGQLQRYTGPDPVPMNDRAVKNMVNEIRALGQAERTYTTLKARTVPQRFTDLVNYRAARETVNTLYKQGIVKDVPAAMNWVRNGVLEQIPGWNDAVYRANQRGIARSWQTLKASGDDPVFLHRVPEGAASSITNPRLDGSIPSVSYAKQRVADFSAAVDNPAIAITHQAFEMLRKDIGAQVSDDIVRTYGIADAELRAQYMDAAVDAASKTPGSNVLMDLDKLINKRYMQFDPASMGFGEFKPVVGSVSPDKVWVPRPVGQALKMARSKGLSDMRVYSDPVTRAMRVSLLALSPRWHMYNIVGGALMTAGIAGPSAFKNTMTGFRVAREAVYGAGDIGKIVDIPKVLREQFGSLGREEAELSLKRGATLSKWWQQSRARQVGNKVVTGSYDFNAFVDTMYKTMSYLNGEEQALKAYTKAGYSATDAKILAQQDGINMARQVLQDTGGMTPFERSVIRQVVPFYGWLSHLMRFAFNFPVDHPWRASIVASAGHQVYEMLGDGASLDMLDILYFGEPDAKGEQSAIKVGALNPFGDIGNLFTLAGWLGNTNPLFKTALQTLGVDELTGTPDLYPTLSYSPETGRLTADTGNPVTNLIANTIPQTRVVSGLLGLDPEQRALRRLDPETADRLMWSGLGLPTAAIPKRDSVDQRYMKAELARQDIRKKRINELIKAGDLQGLASLPDVAGKEGSMEKLATLIGQLQQSGQLAPFTPPEEPAA